MKGASKVIMGATLVMVISLAIVLTLILVLLAELYCSLLLRRRRQVKKPTTDEEDTTAAAATTTTTSPIFSTSSQRRPPQDDQDKPNCSPLSSFYAQGVLHAPRNFLFPAALPCKQKNLHFEKDELHGAQESNTSPHQIGILSPTSPLSTSFGTSPQPAQEISIQVGSSGTNIKENFVYISNPIYDNEADGVGRPSMPDTPFETPDSSPSRLENGGSSGEDDEQSNNKAEDSDNVGVKLKSVFYSTSPPLTPPLSPMKKLPAQACSVSLRDARSLLVTSGSDSNSNNGLSSSSSGSPCTSPSW
ncbi:hypothetical protein CCACVL1_06186 [Corchorus capsularis]|uniref:Uncharacterized protein n=1 Tax=Corchorus capsularis TaxID=210143 RepID=A0A1R3JH06_COCAP|nr:hypothetical protein CCACVL1_06186 [Corchorus capsularis]